MSEPRQAQDPEGGEPAERLAALLYDELRRLAARLLARERPGHTLQPTALVHEAYLRLGAGDARPWQGRGHFFAAAARAMRRILVESARRKDRLKHGGGRERDELADAVLAVEGPSEDVLAVDEALRLFATHDGQAARLVELVYFVGLTVEEAADALGVSARTAYRDWAYARAWLYRCLNGGPAA